MINDVLEMSRIESGRMDLEPIEIDLRKTLTEVWDMFSTQMAEKKLAFTVDTENVSDSLVLCDKNRLNRVLLNLVSNAYKYTPEGGTVSVALVQKGRTDEDKGCYELRVKDSGIGMSKEFAAKVFEAFEREENAKEIEGTGLGMAITKSIIEMMGGEIRVDTEQGRGTEVVVELCLPLVFKEETGTEKSPDPPEKKKTADLSGKRILLVEDIAVNREICSMQLKSFGLTVETAENGKEALEKLKDKEAGFYDAILMDIQMPVMNGYEAAEIIRTLEDEEKRTIPIIALTANAFSEDVKRVIEAGMNAHVAKPIDPKVLKNVLTDILG